MTLLLNDMYIYIRKVWIEGKHLSLSFLLVQFCDIVPGHGTQPLTGIVHLCFPIQYLHMNTNNRSVDMYGPILNDGHPIIKLDSVALKLRTVYVPILDNF